MTVFLTSLHFNIALYAILIFLLLLEYRWYGKESTLSIFFRDSKTMTNDVGFFVLSTPFLYGFVVNVATFGIGMEIYHTFREYLGHHKIAVPYIGLQLLFAFLAEDFLNYVKHTVLHKVWPWWSVHKVHHAATVLTILTTKRSHPLESFVSRWVKVLPFAFFDITFVTLSIFHLVKLTSNYLHHSSFRLHLGPLNYLLVTPQYHWLHHYPDAEGKETCNLGSFFTIWDVLFGTAKFPKDWNAPKQSFGITELEGRDFNLIEGLSAPYVDAFNRLKAIVGKSFAKRNS